jgi:hypothetical protein
MSNFLKICIVIVQFFLIAWKSHRIAAPDAVSTGRCNTYPLMTGRRMLPMSKYRPRIHYTEAHKALMWDRWQQGESLHEIARLFDR